MKNMIHGYNKASDAGLDTSSFSVFMEGCNLNCPYCMNCRLIKRGNPCVPNIVEKLKDDVDAYKPDMIMISGGEPTCRILALYKATGLFKSWGCKVGLSTNGTHPNILEKFVSKYNKIDYVSLDLKGDAEVYEKLGDSEYFFRVIHSWLILRREKKARPDFNYEMRTTLYPPFITLDMIFGLSKLFKKDERWILQQFRLASNMTDPKAKDVKPFEEETLKALVEASKEAVPNVEIRYV